MRGRAVDGQHGGLLRRQLLHQFRVLCRPDKADQGTAFAHQAYLGTRRNGHLEYDVGLCPQLGCANDDVCADRAIRIVTEIGRVTCTGFDRNLKPQLDQLLDNIRNSGNPLFPDKRLRRNSNTHKSTSF